MSCVHCVCFGGVGVRGEGRREGPGESNKSLRLSRFAWEALKPVICSMMPLQQTLSACVWRGAQWRSAGPVSSSNPHRAPIVWPADVSAATPRHLPLPVGGGRGWQAIPTAEGAGGRVQCQRGHLSWIWPVLTSSGERDGVHLSIIWCQLPSNYYLLAHT